MAGWDFEHGQCNCAGKVLTTELHCPSHPALEVVKGNRFEISSLEYHTNGEGKVHGAKELTGRQHNSLGLSGDFPK